MMRKKTRNLLILAGFLFTQISVAQTGGTGTYKFLELPVTARGASLGGKNISINDNDINLANMNPALLGPATANNITLNYINYYAEIGIGYAAYARHYENIGTFALGLQYIDYGKFQGADIVGNKTSNFYASDYTFNLMYAYAIDSFFTLGVNLKPVYSVYEREKSFGLAADFGLTYTSPDRNLTVAATIRNAGFQVTKYVDTREALAYEFLLGVTKKLAHAPFRFSLTAHSLQKYNMRFEEKEDEDDNGFYSDSKPKESELEKFSDNLFRHIIGAVEFVPSKSFYVGLAYNYQRRQEMALDDNPGMTGFSFGGGFRTKRFAFSYGRSVLHISGGANFFSLTVNLASGLF